MLPVSSWLKQEISMKHVASRAWLLHAGFLLGLFFDPKGGGNILL
jgi:hypothetical protein